MMKRIACCLALACLLLVGMRASLAEAPVDYAGELKLDMTSDTLKQEVTVHAFIDGDTTHFDVPASIAASGVLKARYLAINTPETTNRVEEYGKAAARFTQERLSTAASILIESDDGRWNLDSTSERHLVWVWYKPDAASDYRNLNVEILQNGLAVGNAAASNRYGEWCTAALAQAKAQGLNLYSGEPDPDFDYGDALELTIRELRCDPERYDGRKVAFTGIITMNDAQSVYMEAYDPETDRCYGVCVYYGYGMSAPALNVLKVGNESHIVGTFQYHAPSDTYQVAGLSYRMMDPDDPDNIQKIGEGQPAYAPLDPETFARGTAEVQTGEGVRAVDCAELALFTTVQLQDLRVADAAEDADGLRLTCTAGDVQVQVRADAAACAGLTADGCAGGTIDVRGIVLRQDGTYLIRAFETDAVTLHP